jgi:hypothetical protein
VADVRGSRVFDDTLATPPPAGHSLDGPPPAGDPLTALAG